MRLLPENNTIEKHHIEIVFWIYDTRKTVYVARQSRPAPENWHMGHTVDFL